MFDALISAVVMKRMVFFLANYSLFKRPILNWFFNTFYCIPVQRHQDMKDVPLQNEDNFSRAIQHLAQGGCLYIAPEGSSFMERKLRPFKTGTARIALNAEKESAFKLGLNILPIGLNYSAPSQFRSRLHIRFGEPIKVKHYQEVFANDNINGVKCLTEILTVAQKKLIIEVENPREERFLRQTEEILQNENRVDADGEFNRSKLFSEKINSIKNQNLSKYQELENEVLFYHKRLIGWKIQDLAVKNPGIQIGELIPLSLSFPFFLVGWLTNFIPCKIPALLVDSLKFYMGYHSTVKFLVGMIVFPAYYFGFYKFIAWLIEPWWVALLIVFTIPFLGLFAWKWLEKWRFLKGKMNLRHDPQKLKVLAESRAKITALLPAFLKS